MTLYNSTCLEFNKEEEHKTIAALLIRIDKLEKQNAILYMTIEMIAGLSVSSADEFVYHVQLAALNALIEIREISGV